MIGIIGDLHFKESLRYADHVSDRREGERQAVLNAIVDAFQDCDTVVFMGDNFDVKNNPNQVVRAFTAFVERFRGKKLFILAGNHEKTADGKTAIDYLKEIKNPNWYVITNGVFVHQDMMFCPYFYKQELGEETFAGASQALLNMLRGMKTVNSGPPPAPPVRYLFAHHAISDTLTHSGTSTSVFNEIVLPKTELEESFSKVIGGHIHQPGEYGKTLVTGCTFTNEVGDDKKFAWKLDPGTAEITPVPLPGRPILKLENPDISRTLAEIPDEAIVKAVLTDRDIPVDAVKQQLRRFDAYILLQQYPNERKQLDIEQGAMLEFSVESLIKAFAKEKQLDESKLLAAWEEIRT